MDGKAINLDHVRDWKWRSFTLADIWHCHFISDTVDTACTDGFVHLQTLPRPPVGWLQWGTLETSAWVNLSGPCWVSGEKEMLKDRIWLCLSLLPCEQTPTPYWYLALTWICPLTLWRQKSLQIYMGGTAWSNKCSERGRKTAQFSKCGQKKMSIFLFLDHNLFSWGC